MSTRGHQSLKLILRQRESTAETRSVVHAAMLADIPSVACAPSGLDHWGEALRKGEALPVGSVEFVRAAMDVAGLTEPAWSPYPDWVIEHLHRPVRRSHKDQVEGRCFVKPVQLKQWTGMVVDTSASDGGVPEWHEEDWRQFQLAVGRTEVWVSEVVEWLCEYRIYVCDGYIVGRARYDQDGAEDAPELYEQAVKAMLDAGRDNLGGAASWALDVGVLSTGETACVEVTDGWAIGLYGAGAVSPGDYLRLLASRWRQIASAP